MIMIANLQYAWTLFVDPLQKGTGWKLSDIQFAFTLFILFQTWVQPLDGWLIDRLGPRGFITAAGRAVRSRLGGHRLRHLAADALRALLRGRHRRGVRLQRLDWIGAQVVQGAARARLRHHGGGLRRRHGAVHPVHPVDDQRQRLSVHVRRDRHPAGRRHRRRRAVPEAPAGGAGCRQGRDQGRGDRREETVHDDRSAADAAVLRDVRRVRADGDRRAAGDGQRRTDGQVVGLLDHARRHAEPARQRRGAHLLGLGLGSTRTREHDDLHVRAAGALPGGRRHAWATSPARGSRRRWSPSTSPGARSIRCSRPRPATTSAPSTRPRTTRCCTRRRASPRSSAGTSARCSTSSPAAGRWASTAAP